MGVRNPCRIMMRLRVIIGLCIGDEIMVDLNYAKKTMVSLLLGSKIAHQGDFQKYQSCIYFQCRTCCFRSCISYLGKEY